MLGKPQTVFVDPQWHTDHHPGRLCPQLPGQERVLCTVCQAALGFLRSLQAAQCLVWRQKSASLLLGCYRILRTGDILEFPSTSHQMQAWRMQEGLVMAQS